MKDSTLRIIQVLACGCLFLVGCSPENDTTVSIESAEEASTNEFAWANAPETAPGLLDALKTSETGDPIVFTGRVGGTRNPVAQEFAGFVVADESIQFCDEISGDEHCPTPWDACCEDPDKIAQSRAFVQFTDAAGNPRIANLEEAIGLNANDTVMVRGILSRIRAPETASSLRRPFLSLSNRFIACQ